MSLAAMRFFGVTALLLCALARAKASDKVLGCGGHVQAEGNLDLSKVVVKLLTKQGALKYETDVAPNNGYFFLPVYDKGDYVVKVEPPNGWTFEPSSIPVSIDGATDACSTEKDLNFVFQGFSVLGKVTSGDGEVGPAGVTVVLSSAAAAAGGGGVELARAVTGPDGDFMFPNVNRGSYALHLEHPRWRVRPGAAPASADARVPVAVDAGNGVVATGALRVSGFDVSGRVTSEGEPVGGVRFALYGSPGAEVEGCSTATATAGAGAADPVDEEAGFVYKCWVASGEAGGFEFPAVSPGTYRIVPSFVLETGGVELKFDVRPSLVEFQVTAKGSLRLEQEFVVAGFGVTGHVLTTSGTGLAGAKVFFGGREVGVSDAGGAYSIASVKTGEYVVEASADGYEFEPVGVKISPRSPVLPDLTPARVRVCGKLGVSGLPSTVKVAELAVVAEGATSFRVGSDGSWCGFLPPGPYVLRVSVPDSARGSGLSFAPYDRKVTVGDGPLGGLDFVQFKAVVSGRVSCSLGGGETCAGVSVVLKPALETKSEGYKPRSFQLKPSPDESFEFTDVLPGPYDVSVSAASGVGFCWDAAVRRIEVSASDVRDVAFRRTGVSVSFESSHETDVDVFTTAPVPTPAPVKDGTGDGDGVVREERRLLRTFRLAAGRAAEQCFETVGVYEFVPRGCHWFGDKPVVVDAARPDALKVALKASRHVLRGVVRADVAVDDLVVVMSEGGNVLGELGPLKPAKSGPTWDYAFEFLASPGDELTVAPRASQLLFDPADVAVTMRDDCLGVGDAAGTGDGPVIAARRGLFFSGVVAPPLADVTVAVAKKDGGGSSVEVKTGADGRYVVGPLRDGDFYEEPTARKDGYAIEKVASSARSEPYSRKLDFAARKLAEISVVATSDSDEPLSGVLVTVSGAGGYRQNRLTAKDGRISFIGLSPGEYFVKPVLKEYKFEPSSVVVTVAEGATLNVDARAVRVAYSAFGSVLSLAGEPEPGVTVEAVGLETADCRQYAEEAVSEPGTGSFRIRGLLPSCRYLLRVAGTGDGNGVGGGQRFEWAPSGGVPVSVAGRSDVRGLRLVLFRPAARMTVSGAAETDDEEALASLRAVVIREDRPDVEVTSKQLCKGGGATSALFVLPVGLERDPTRRYVLRLESSLSKTAWDYRTPEVVFTADRAFRHFEFEFRPTRRSTDQDFKETSVVVLPFVILVAFAAVNFGKIWPSVAALAGRVGGGGGGSSSSASASPTSGGGGGASSSSGQDVSGPDMSWVDLTSGGGAKKKVKAKKA